MYKLEGGVRPQIDPRRPGPGSCHPPVPTCQILGQREARCGKAASRVCAKSTGCSNHREGGQPGALWLQGGGQGCWGCCSLQGRVAHGNNGQPSSRSLGGGAACRRVIYKVKAGKF
jgi:hypothetical protein